MVHRLVKAMIIGNKSKSRQPNFFSATPYIGNGMVRSVKVEESVRQKRVNQSSQVYNSFLVTYFSEYEY